MCLNSVMNGRILLETDFEDVVVQPAANDAGTALGACYWLWNTVLRQPRTYVFEHAYFGPWMTHAPLPSRHRPDGRRRTTTVDRAARRDDAPRLAAEMLADGKIIGWFQGRMEMGPRALGNRSILADPRSDEMKDLLNARVKFRESFRPFAPSVLEDKNGRVVRDGLSLAVHDPGLRRAAGETPPGAGHHARGRDRAASRPSAASTIRSTIG